MTLLKTTVFTSVSLSLLLFAGLIFLPSAVNVESNNNPIYDSPAMPVGLSFAGEPVPAEDFDVVERLERELLVNAYWHSQTIYTLKKTTRFLPTIEKILKEENIPDDIKYIAVIESSLANVVSPAGAAGFWQFMPETGKMYGLEVNEEVDERYHLERATRAAARYMNDAYVKFGSWTLAAASYNMGVNGVQNQLAAQGVNSYYDLYLNTETARYMFRILAMKDIIRTPEKYRFDLSQTEYYTPIMVRKVDVKTAVDNWAIWALQQGTTYKTLRLLNPWIRKPYLKNKEGKTYTVEIPIAAKPGTKTAELRKLNASDALLDDGNLPIPEVLSHEVKKGETLFGLAKKFNVTPEDIIKANDLQNKNLSEGQIIQIPLKK